MCREGRRPFGPRFSTESETVMLETPYAQPPVPARREPWRAIFLAVLLGLLAGFVHGWNLSLACLLILVVFFNVRARVFLLIWLLGVGLSWLLIPMTYAVGRFTLDQTPVGDFLALFGDLPSVRLLGLDRYTVVGGIVVAMLLAIPACVTVRNWVRRLRAAHEQSERESLGARFGRWLYGTTSTVASEPVVRPFGLWMAVIAIGGLSLFVWWFVPRRAEALLFHSLVSSNGAPVTAERFELDFWSGTLEAENLSFSDGKTDQSWVRVARVSASVDATDLLQGRINCKQAQLEGIETSQKDTLDPGRSDLAGAANLPEKSAPTVLDPASYLREWNAVENQWRSAERVFRLIENLQDLDNLLAARARRDASSMRRWASARSALGSKRPTVYVRELVLRDPPGDWRLSPGAKICVKDVSSTASFTPRPTRLEVTDNERGLQFSATLNLRDEPYRHRIELRSSGIALANHLMPPGSKQPIECEAGVGDVFATGWASRDELDLALEVHLSQLTARIAGQDPIAGVAADSWNEALAQIHDLRLLARVNGTAKAPCITFAEPELLREVAQSLKSHGQSGLAAAFVAPEPEEIPTAKIVASRGVAAEPLAPPVVAAQANALPEPAQPPVPTIREIAEIAPSPPPVTLPQAPKPQIVPLPPVSLSNVALTTASSPVSINFAPPTATIQQPVVCDTPRTNELLPEIAETWEPAAVPTNAIATTPRAEYSPPTSSQTLPDGNNPGGFHDDQPAAPPKNALARWSDSMKGMMSTLFSPKDREEAEKFSNDPLTESFEEDRLSDSRNGSRFQRRPPATESHKVLR